MRYVNFTSAEFARCEIEGSDFTDSFFAECTFKTLLVSNSQFIRTEFFHTSLRGIDFSDSALDGICISADGRELAGIIVSFEQAAALSKILGVVIKDDAMD